jgi:hypothetical protein
MQHACKDWRTAAGFYAHGVIKATRGVSSFLLKFLKKTPRKTV